jgi:hypothetical protein
VHFSGLLVSKLRLDGYPEGKYKAPTLKDWGFG